MKLDAIKQQILSKLNLANAPNVSGHRMPHEFAMEIIRKAKLNAAMGAGGGDQVANRARRAKSKKAKHRRHNRRESEPLTLSTYNELNDSDYTRNKDFLFEHKQQNAASVDDNDNDEYYSKTSEIIAFAEPGK